MIFNVLDSSKTFILQGFMITIILLVYIFNVTNMIKIHVFRNKVHKSVFVSFIKVCSLQGNFPHLKGNLSKIFLKFTLSPCPNIYLPFVSLFKSGPLQSSSEILPCSQFTAYPLLSLTST